MTAAIEVRRAGDRFLTRTRGVETRHSFSFGAHWDASNTGHGRLVVHDEHRLQPAAGFPSHLHRDLDVVTCVLEGELVHQDDSGRREVLPEGTVAHLHTGRGVVHAEHAGPSGARFVQSWLTTDRPVQPAWTSHLPGSGFTEALRVGTAALHVGGLGVGPVPLPTAHRRHVFVAAGALQVHGSAFDAALGEGDALRLTGVDVALHVPASAVLLVWALDEVE